MNTYVIDIDGTLCSDSDGSYGEAIPNYERIAFINQLYKEGHRIVIFTARGMGSSANNREIAIEKWFDFTKKQLSGWGLNYHELHLGKPAGDAYIDDKGINGNAFFKKLK
jgi:hypothetical protein